MAVLLTLKGPNAGHQFPLESATIVLGRQADSTICLESQAVSRHHARILLENGDFFVEDLQSSNGTYLNGKRIRSRIRLTKDDTLQIGPYQFAVRQYPQAKLTDTDQVIREKVAADPSNLTFQGVDAANKLQVVLEITQHLALTLDEETLLGKFLDHLMRLFPQTERGMVLRCEGEKLEVRAQRSRHPNDNRAIPYSRTVVMRALSDGIGILSEDAQADQRFQASTTVTSLNLHSLLCVPLIGHNGTRLGVVQLDSLRTKKSFQMPDLQLLTALALQAAVVLENAALHAELLQKERLRQELVLAREIQQGFLPAVFPRAEEQGYELCAQVNPAREVSGDFYDFFPLGDGKLAFFVGDVSGKGIPAALYMVAVRTLSRHLAPLTHSPAETLARLNPALAADNPSMMFVTLLYGIYDPGRGEVVLASGGHPAPLLRRADGLIDTLPLKSGRFLGYEVANREKLTFTDYQLVLEPGETLIGYTDGFTEARAPDRETFFGLDRLKEALGGEHHRLSLDEGIDAARAAVERFTKTTELQDDLTLLMLRRVSVRNEVS
jgi:serine phosphatase RsbU (regulator of sigma subunit)/pSer/pThr/pTyr-binding forkhead associated (FHA) protein